MALQEFIMTDFERIKLASMIYGVSKRKGEGFGYHQKPFNTRTKTLIKPLNPSSSSSFQKGLYSQFVPGTNAKVLNQSELITVELEVLKNIEPETSRSKILKKFKPMTLKSKVLK